MTIISNIECRGLSIFVGLQNLTEMELAMAWEIMREQT